MPVMEEEAEEAIGSKEHIPEGSVVWCKVGAYPYWPARVSLQFIYLLNLSVLIHDVNACSHFLRFALLERVRIIPHTVLVFSRYAYSSLVMLGSMAGLIQRI
jgi:hypothetical protein